LRPAKWGEFKHVRLALSQSGGGDAVRQFLRQQGRTLGLHLILAAPEASGGPGHSRNLPANVHNRMDSHWLVLKPAAIELAGNYRLIAWPRGKSAGWLTPRLPRAVMRLAPLPVHLTP